MVVVYFLETQDISAERQEFADEVFSAILPVQETRVDSMVKGSRVGIG
jgi:hypothetical protein